MFGLVERTVCPMAIYQRFATLALIAAAIVVSIIDVAVYSLAVASLLGGASVAGFDSLALANHLAAVVAALAALSVIARTVGAKRVTVPAFSLLLASGITGLIAVGLYAIGKTLFPISNQTVIDNGGNIPGSAALQLNSLLSGVMGSGYDLAPAPVVLAIGALVVWGVAGLRRWRLASRTFPASGRVEAAPANVTA